MPPADAREPWTIFVVQHSHIDRGFTDRQEAVAAQHADFIRQAVALASAPAQAARPPEARFKFTCEGFWAIEQYLARADAAGRDALVAGFRSGLLELTAFRFHLTELLDEGHLRDTLAPAVEFARRHGLPLECAMACDINGLPWAFVDALAEAGVRHLSVNLNSHHGGHPRGGPLVPFWWESAHGRRVLVWNGLAYHKANLLGLMGGCCPDGRLGIPGVDAGLPDAAVPTGPDLDVRDLALAERKVGATLAGLACAGYPRRWLLVTGSGVYTDNSPPGDACCDLIARWNERHGDRVRIRTATLAEFFAHLAAHEPAIPVWHGDWPDWWADGVAAAPRDTLLFRHAQRTKRLVERLDPAARVVPAAERAALADRLALYAEHTFAFSETKSPALLTQQVFARKSRLAAEADEAAGAAFDRVRTALGEGAFTARRSFRYAVVNPHDHVRPMLAGLPLDQWEAPVVVAGFRVRTADGGVLPHQLERGPRGWLVQVVVSPPAGGRVELALEPAPANAPPAAPDPADAAGAGPLEFANDHYALRFDPVGGLVSIRDTATGVELVDPAAGRGVGAPVYQVFPGGDRAAAGGFAMAPRTIPRAEVHAGRLAALRCTADGPVFREWELTYTVPGASRYTVAVRAGHALPGLALAARLHKLPVDDPEGFHVAFPVGPAGGVWHLDRAGGAVRPGVDQLPGTCCDHYLVQDGAACCGPAGGVAWTTLDAPLVQLGTLRLWHYTTAIEPHGPLFSWVTNNKWECNFPVRIADPCECRYFVAAGHRFRDPAAALAEVRAAAVPPVVLRL